jgi:cobalt-zinc-cadmium efflux system outer membrane protein
MLFVFFVGCSHVPIEKRFQELQSDVDARTGQHIEWVNVSSDEREVIDEVKQMLQGELSSEEAVCIALLNNRRLQAIYGEYGIALTDLVQAGLPTNPVAEILVQFQEDSEFDLRAWEITVMQDFLDMLLIPLRRKLATAEFERARLHVIGEVVDLVTDTRIAYYRLQTAQQNLDLSRSVLLSYEASTEMAHRLQQAGNVTEGTALTERSDYEYAKLETAAAEKMVAEQRESLNKLMGLWGSNADWTVGESLPPVPEDDVNLDDVEQRAVDASIDLAKAWTKIEQVARRNRIKAIETVIPELSIGAEFDRETEIETEIGENAAGEPELNRSKGPDLWWRGPAVAIAIPIFDQGHPARTRKALAVRQAWDEFTAMAVEIRAEARLTRYRYQYHRDVANYYDDVIVPVQQRLRALTQLQYNAMFLGVFQLIETKREELDSERRYTESLRDYWIARARLDQLLMGRVPNDVGRAGDSMDGREPEMASVNRKQETH